MKKKELQKDKERTWFLVKDWKTKSGLRARIYQCVWNRDVVATPLLHDFFTGYIQVPQSSSLKDTQNTLDAHGGITFGYPKPSSLIGTRGKWVGFDMAHCGDENVQDLEYVTKECENLANQINP